MNEFMRVAKDAGPALQIPASLSLTIILSFVIWGYRAIINLSSVRQEEQCIAKANRSLLTALRAYRQGTSLVSLGQTQQATLVILKHQG